MKKKFCRHKRNHPRLKSIADFACEWRKKIKILRGRQPKIFEYFLQNLIFSSSVKFIDFSHKYAFNHFTSSIEYISTLYGMFLVKKIYLFSTSSWYKDPSIHSFSHTLVCVCVCVFLNAGIPSLTELENVSSPFHSKPFLFYSEKKWLKAISSVCGRCVSWW